MKGKKLHEVGQLIAACEVYISSGNKILMHKRADDKKIFPGYWIGPGGHIEWGEDVLAGALREIKEETGISLDTKNLKLKVLSFHHHLDRGEIWVEYIFLANVAEEQKATSTKEGESFWIEKGKLLKMKNVFPPSKHYFEHVLNDKKGILYNFSTWKNAKLVKDISQKVGY